MKQIPFSHTDRRLQLIQRDFDNLRKQFAEVSKANRELKQFVETTKEREAARERIIKQLEEEISRLRGVTEVVWDEEDLRLLAKEERIAEEMAMEDHS